MEHHYQVTFTKALIADYDITFIRDVMSRYLEVDHLTFNQAFKRKSLVFQSKMNVDDAQLCLTELEAAGIKAQIEKFGPHVVTGPSSECESTLSDDLPEPVLPNLLQSLLPNNANSAVVVFSYLIVFYQVVSFFS